MSTEDTTSGAGEVGPRADGSRVDGPRTTEKPIEGVATETAPPPPGENETPVMPPREKRLPTQLQPAWVAGLIAAAVAADVALRRPPWNNVAFTILIAVMAVGLATSGLIRTTTSRIMLGGAVILGVLLAIRTEPILTLFNFGAAIALLLGAALFGQGRDIWDFGPARVISDGLSVIEKSIMAPFAVAQEAGVRYQHWEASDDAASRAVVRGLAIAAPIVVILGLLLASADVVFQSFFSGINLGGASIFGHLFLAAVGAWAFVTLLSLAARQDGQSVVNPVKRALGSVETAIILGSITALFSVFAVAQVLTIMGGADEALTRAGLEPNDHRGGGHDHQSPDQPQSASQSLRPYRRLRHGGLDDADCPGGCYPHLLLHRR